VARRLVAAREERHVHEQRAHVVGRHQRRAAVVERHVGVEEQVLEVVEDHDAVRGERHRVHRWDRQPVLVRHHLADAAA